MLHERRVGHQNFMTMFSTPEPGYGIIRAWWTRHTRQLGVLRPLKKILSKCDWPQHANYRQEVSEVERQERLAVVTTHFKYRALGRPRNKETDDRAWLQRGDALHGKAEVGTYRCII